MGSFQTLEVTRAGAVATLTLDRPKALNAWNEQLAQELCAAVADLGADDSVRAVTITGRGRAFSAGADVNEGFPEGAGGHWDIHTRLVGVHHPIITGVREMPKPVVAAVMDRRPGSAAHSRWPVTWWWRRSRPTSCSRS